jgi:hypothetical protein
VIKWKFIPICFVVLFVFFSLGSCLPGPPPLENFLIQVDSIHVPEKITANTPFYIEFYGVVGYDGCHSFDNFNLTYKNNDISVQTWGKYDNKAETCPDVIVFLNGQKLNITIPFPGVYRLLIVEPYGYDLVKQIIVD